MDDAVKWVVIAVVAFFAWRWLSNGIGVNAFLQTNPPGWGSGGLLQSGPWSQGGMMGAAPPGWQMPISVGYETPNGSFSFGY